VNASASTYGQTNGGQSKAFGKAERMIARRYLSAKKSEGGVGLIALLSFICIMLAIWAMITIMSIMNGFREDLIRLTIGSEGHMYVATSSPAPTQEDLNQLEYRLAQVPGVEKAFQFSQNLAGVQANGRISVAQVIGISSENLNSFDLIASNIQFGSLAEFGQGRGLENQVAMGARLAASIGLTVGDRVVIYSGRTRTTVTGSQPIIKAYTIGAIFEVGLLQTDMSYIYMDLDQATLLFEDGQPPGTIQIRLDNPDDIDKMSSPISEAAGEPVFLQTWKDKNGPTATALRTEQIAMRMIFMIVVIISTFPVLAAMIMLVKNKSKDIAILRTIGATRRSILRIFFMSGAMIGMLGTIVGLIAGILFCLNIGAVQWAIETVTGTELFPADVYQLSSGIPVKIVWSEVLGVSFWGFLISAAATFFPALNASKIDPVDALRYE